MRQVGQRRAGGEGLQHVGGGGGAAGGGRLEQGGDDGGLDVGAGAAACGGGDGIEVEYNRITFAPRQVDAGDVAAHRRAGQVDEEDLVEAALAQQLRRQGGDVGSGCGGHGVRLGLFDHLGSFGLTEYALLHQTVDQIDGDIGGWRGRGRGFLHRQVACERSVHRGIQGFRQRFRFFG